MSIGRRLEKLEGAQAERGCHCPYPFEIREYTGPASKADAEKDTTPADACPACGELRTFLKVVYPYSGNGVAL